MKIKALKSGRFAHPEPDKPQVVLTEGELIDRDVDDALACELILTGWGEEVEEIPADVPKLKDMKKSELIAYAVENDIDLDPEATNKEMREAIEAALPSE